MPYLHAITTAATSRQPLDDSAEALDALLFDDESDEFLDRQIFAIRESLADFRNL
jgi:hypothetical protein